MKKILFLGLFILPLISVFFNCDEVNALSMNVNGVETEVTEENFVYYIYSLNKDKFEDYSHFVIFTRTDGRKTLILTNSHSQHYFGLKGNQFWTGTGYFCNYTVSYELVSCSEQTQTQTYFGNFSTSLPFYANSDIFNYGTEEILYTANITLDDLKKFGQVIKKYKITYYLNNDIYREIEVEEGTSHELLSYNPPEHYNFSGWNIDGLDLTNITNDLNIYGTTSYVRPNMNYSENIDSTIHELSLSIIGKNVPVEFDYVYVVMDFIILLVLVLCVIAPFVILIKLLSGRW